MKRLYFIIAGIVLTFFISTNKTDAQDWEVIWKKLVHPTPAFTWMKDSLSFTGLAYDRVRDKLYVVSPKMLNGVPDPHVYILNPSNGDSLGELPIDHNTIKSGFSSGQFCLFKIQVADDGKIYACNLVSPLWEICYPGPPPNCDPKFLKQGSFTIYKWDTPTSNPTIVYSTPKGSTDTSFFSGGMSYTRWGDAFAVKGKYDSTLIFVSGGDPSGRPMNSEFNVFQTTDSTTNSFILKRKVQCGINGLASQGIAATGISQHRPVWVDSHTGPASLQTQSPESYNITSIPDSLTGHSGPIRFFEMYGSRFVVVADGKNIANQVSTSARIINVNNPSSFYSSSPTPPVGNYALQLCSGTKNWVSDVDYKWNNNYLYVFVLMSGNGIAVCRFFFVPVELLSIEANVLHNVIRLQWRTATETNNQGFEIQRSYNKTFWEKVAFVNGFGTTSEPHEYFFDDPIDNIKNNSREVSYRLKQIDYDGTIDYSPIVTILLSDRNEKSFRLENYPNPFGAAALSGSSSTSIQFQLQKPTYVTLKIFNALGQEVQRVIDGQMYDAGVHDVKIELSRKKSEILFYQLITPENIQTKKMILLN